VRFLALSISARSISFGGDRLASLSANARSSGFWQFSALASAGSASPVLSRSLTTPLSFVFCAKPIATNYFAVVLDAYSRRIVGWSMATTFGTQLVLDARPQPLSAR
jgi:transposase InsO family protein